MLSIIVRIPILNSQCIYFVHSKMIRNAHRLLNSMAVHPFPLPIRWGEGGRRSGEGWFMESEHLQKLDVSWGHEPAGIPLNRPPGTFSPTGGEGRDEGGRVMESLHSLLRMHWDHEPDWHPSPFPLPARRGEGGRRPAEGRFMGRERRPKTVGRDSVKP